MFDVITEVEESASAMTLRPYQQEAADSVLREWEEHSRTLIVLPTGTGKTIVFSGITSSVVAQGGRVLILAHREELLMQAADKLHASMGLRCAVEKAKDTCLGSWYRVVVGSVQTLMRQDRLDQFEPSHFTHIIVDEAHHALANSYQAVLNYFDAKVLGVTATPDRGDMRELGEYFESLAYEYLLPQAIKDGYLCKIMAKTLPLKIDISNVGMSQGDYKLGELGDSLEPYLEQIVAEMKTHCSDRKSVVFLPLIRTSQTMCDMLIAAGFRAAEVNGKSKDRAEVLADFDAGKYDVLCNSMLLTEGWDCPSVDCIICLRPTKIRSLYCQIVGRGTRPSPDTGKENLLILDFLWNTNKHSLCRPANLIATQPEVAVKMTEMMEEAAEDDAEQLMLFDLEQLEDNAEEELVHERELSLAKALREQRKKKARLVDPLQYEMSISAEDLADYRPSFGWEMAPPSRAQTTRLEKAGINPESIQSAGHASMLIDRIEKRRNSGMSTPRQIRALERYGFEHVGNISFEQASSMIDRIAANGWRKPHGMVAPSAEPPPITPNQSLKVLN